MPEKNAVICVTNHILLMWAEPDTGSYNYQLYPIRKRWVGTDKAAIPNDIVERIKKNASPYYPILIVDGWKLEELVNKLTTTHAHLASRSFGDHPRIVTSTSETKHKNSVNEFLAAVAKGETF